MESEKIISADEDYGYEKIEDFDNEACEQVDESNADTRKRTLKESLMDFLTNSRYMIINANLHIPKVTNDKVELSMHQEDIYLLGVKYSMKEKDNVHSIQEEMNSHFNSIIWFSYRRNFPKLKPVDEGDLGYISDTNWGCMIRTGQMIFAETLKRYLRKGERLLFDDNKDLFAKIISLFLDAETKAEAAPFSIQQITKHASKEFNLKPGQWHKATTIAWAFEALNDDYKKVDKSFENLEVMIFQEGCIFLDQVYQKARGSFATSLCFDCYKIYKEIEKREREGKELRRSGMEKEEQDIYYTSFCRECRKWKKSLFLLICLKVGSEEPNIEYFPLIQHLLKDERSVGILGGYPRRALYFVGYQGDNLIMLDPHYVQDSLKNFTPETNHKTDLLNSYFHRDIRSVSMESIDSSLAFGFFVKDEEDFQQLFAHLKEGEQTDSWFLGLQNVYVDLDDYDEEDEDRKKKFFKEEYDLDHDHYKNC